MHHLKLGKRQQYYYGIDSLGRHFRILATTIPDALTFEAEKRHDTPFTQLPANEQEAIQERVLRLDWGWNDWSHVEYKVTIIGSRFKLWIHIPEDYRTFDLDFSGPIADWDVED
jgi:hypothetical protein